MREKRAKMAVCAANKVGLDIVDFITTQPYPIEFIATCSTDSTPYKTAISQLCDERHIQIYRDANVNNEEFVKKIKEHCLDIMILAWWPSIIKKEAIDSVKKGWLNMHPSLLPYNRGKHPYYWTITEGTPFGVTLHFIDENIDTGPILFQKEIPVEITDTGESLYKKSQSEITELFKENYRRIATLDFIPKMQDNNHATFHLANQLDPHSQIKLDEDYNAGDLINRVRGRTFTNGKSAFFIKEGKKYWLKMTIEEDKKQE